MKPGSDRSAGMIADPGGRARASGAPTGPVLALGVRSLNSDRDVIRHYGATALGRIADLLVRGCATHLARRVSPVSRINVQTGALLAIVFYPSP